VDVRELCTDARVGLPADIGLSENVLVFEVLPSTMLSREAVSVNIQCLGSNGAKKRGNTSSYHSDCISDGYDAFLVGVGPAATLATAARVVAAQVVVEACAAKTLTFLSQPFEENVCPGPVLANDYFPYD
jgi:hypothetical protein